MNTMLQNHSPDWANFCCPEFQQLRLFDLQLVGNNLLYQDLNSRNKYPGITTILNATWTPGSRKTCSKKTLISKQEAEWTAQNNFTVGTGFHKYMEGCLKSDPVDDFSDLIKALGQSIERTGLLDSLLKRGQVIERFIPWNGHYPYATKLDWFGLMNKEPVVIDWTWKYKRVNELSDLGDKLLQVTAQMKACRDFFALPVERALIVAAHPFSEATIFTIECDRLGKCWKDELLPRLRRFYDKRFFDVG